MLIHSYRRRHVGLPFISSSQTTPQAAVVTEKGRERVEGVRIRRGLPEKDLVQRGACPVIANVACARPLEKASLKEYMQLTCKYSSHHKSKNDLNLCSACCRFFLHEL